MKQQKKRREFNDLLLPVILTVSILPLISHLIIYDSGLSKYSWYSANGTFTDFFSYYKSIFIIIISIISAVILMFFIFLQRKYLQSMKPFITIGIYALFVLLSTVFSVDIHTSLIGGFGHFESVFVIMGYLVIMVYSYQIEKREVDYKSILKAVIISLLAMCLIGILQMAGRDLFHNEWFQRIVIPRQYLKDFLGKVQSNLSSNAVSLTLFNSNYAAVYLGMMIPFLIVFLLPPKNSTGKKDGSYLLNRKEQLLCILIIIILTILLFKTYSRTGLVSAFIALLVPGYYYRRHLLKNWTKLLLTGSLALFLFIGIDCINHFRYIEKIAGTVKSLTGENDKKPLEEIITGNEGVKIRYSGDEITVKLSVEDGETLKFLDDTGEDITGFYDGSNNTLIWKRFEKIKFSIAEAEDTDYIICSIDGITWKFYKDAQLGYLYINGFGKPDKLVEVERFGFTNSENIGSGRGYIWSRSIPLLKDTLFIGTGPDTYPLVFPQSDYVGKANNCKTPYTIIEKPHNMFMMIGIQTGIMSLIAFLSFYSIYLVKSFKLYKYNDLSTLRDKMGLGCLAATLSFMVSGLFNDSSLQTSPVFFVLLGIGMDINRKISKTKK